MTELMADRHNAVLSANSPRHLDLARALMQDIQNGNPPVGGLLPTEVELCARWGMSRYAVRQAVQKLCSLGMLTRQAGIGTRVVSASPLTRYVQSMDALADLARYAKGTRLQVSTRERLTADDCLADLLRCAPGEKWLHIGGVRYDGPKADDPIALVDMYVAGAYSKLPRLSGHLDVPVYTLIEEQFGVKVSRVEQQIQGILIDGASADALRVRRGSAGLRIVRTYYVRDTVIEVTTGVHPASRFSYSMSFQLAQSGA